MSTLAVLLLALDDTRGEQWIQCPSCQRWAHEECAGVDGISVLFCSTSGTSFLAADHGRIVDEIYEDPVTMHRTNNHKLDIHRHISISNGNTMRQYDTKARGKRETGNPDCANFEWSYNKPYLTHPPKTGNSDEYARNITCFSYIEAKEPTEVIHLTFVDKFHIEEHPTCEYDYIEIRDGKYGFARHLGRYCGSAFPKKITSTGPFLWLKFKSDENIEYSGFKILVESVPGSGTTHNSMLLKDCIVNIGSSTDPARYGDISSTEDRTQKCRDDSDDLDILWNITTPEKSFIYLDFISFSLHHPNDCEKNLVQVFGEKPNSDHMKAFYCGSVANPVMTEVDKVTETGGNRMIVRFYARKDVKEKSKFNAKFAAIRTIKTNEKCIDGEFDCSDGTCIDKHLVCDRHVDCRLKTDEDKDTCKQEEESKMNEPHVLAILIIFSLILSGMSFVFLFKCIRKLYQDHQIIKQHIKQSSEDRLDDLTQTQLTLDAKHLERDSEPRERENHTNEMYKQQRNKRKPSSIDSDFPHDTQLDIDDAMWHRAAESMPIDTDDVRIERKGRSRKSDTSRREESLRSRGKEEERKEIRDASVGTPDTKESGCQTRESLFQVEPAPGSDSTGSGTNSRGFSTFGYSGATIVRPSPAPANTSQITIELLRQATPQESIKSQKKSDRRPMSTETTRSAPDVIIVSKPIR